MMRLVVLVCLTGHPPAPTQCRMFAAPFSLPAAACEAQIETREAMVQASLAGQGYGPDMAVVEGWCEVDARAPGPSV